MKIFKYDFSSGDQSSWKIASIFFEKLIPIYPQLYPGLWSEFAGIFSGAGLLLSSTSNPRFLTRAIFLAWLPVGWKIDASISSCSLPIFTLVLLLESALMLLTSLSNHLTGFLYSKRITKCFGTKTSSSIHKAWKKLALYLLPCWETVSILNANRSMSWSLAVMMM